MGFQILTLSGGGFLGLYTATLLAELEERWKRSIATSFDLIAGTSIGGIIALALAAGTPASKIKAAFEDNGKKIFSKKPPPKSRFGSFWDILLSTSSSKYKSSILRETVEELVGVNTRIGDLRHAVLIPSINLSKGRPQIFKTPHHPDFKLDLHLKVSDVALATSAAPTFFPLAEINDSLFVDGGLYANSPDLFALHEATHFFKIPEQDIRMLSIGTTTSQFSFGHPAEKDFGIYQWFAGQRLMNVIIASQQQSVGYMLGHRLSNRYLRLDANQSKEQERALGLDIATDEAQKLVRALASATFQDHINDTLLKEMMENQAPQPIFYHHLSKQS
ncbi:MAG: patatin-like phospholipase family protein [Nitrospira sp.]|nr:patatin-like phospholipase family protein [Nitrospira sp.]